MFNNYFLLACVSGLVLIHFLPTSSAAQQNSACGNFHNIRCPFRLRDDDPQHYCGDSMYELECINNTTLVMHRYPREYHVRAINYNNHTIRFSDSTIGNDLCSFPNHSLPDDFLLNFLSWDPYYNRFIDTGLELRRVVFLSCPYGMSSSHLISIDHCFERNVVSNASNSSSNRSRHAYIMAGQWSASDFGDMCRIELEVLTSMQHFKDSNNISLQQIHESLVYGFEFSWHEHPANVADRILLLAVEDFATIYIGIGLATRIIIGLPFILWIIIYKIRRKHLSVFDVIEGFLQSHNNLTPIRYSYSEIKKMTKGFREKLGEGGYGSVYKGKLRSGQDVAVKVLTKPRGNGQDFINEVATIGRIHHVNVVKLVGYSAERSKCALVYEFLRNGSLEKYILRQERTNLLSWETMYKIAVGVARGIEYLHRGCDIQILHFDIKPHNILLDDNFTPKISDFGLAKFCSTEINTITLTAARGTIGYVAPELINRSIGSVSYKADVYSFGMLLLEMAGLKRDLVQNIDNSSQYFPYWIYSHFEKGKDVEIGNIDNDGDDSDGARKITRKMAIVGLWCIRMSPDDRPSMGKVVEMLDGEVESLEIPPHSSHVVHHVALSEDQTWGTYSTDSVALLCEDISRNQ